MAVDHLAGEFGTLIGRERELAELGALVRAVHLLTLTGTAGVGKTSLARAITLDLARNRPDSVWWVELQALPDASTLTSTVAAAFDVREHPGAPLLDVLVGALKDREGLLVLDNCEHLKAEVAALVSALLRASAGLRILITSQVNLGIDGETVWRVPPLAIPDVISDDSGTTASYGAVQLFEDRARRVQTGFRIVATNSSTVTKICRGLDGVPLAIELAAARANELTVDEILAGLDDRFRLLRDEFAARDRQRSLESSIAWSYDLLSQDERLVWSWLAAFAGGCTVDAAVTVCAEAGLSEQRTIAAMSGLCERSLMSVVEHHGAARYSMPESIREFGVERLQIAGSEARARDAHLRWCRSVAESAEAEFWGPDRGLWVDRLEQDHTNLRAALSWAIQEHDVDNNEAVQDGLLLAAAAGFFWHFRGYEREGRQWLERLLACGQAETLARAKATHQAAHLAFMQGEVELALGQFRQGGEQAQRIGYDYGVAFCLLGEAAAEQNRGNLSEARRLYLDRPALFETGDPVLRSFWNYGRIQLAVAESNIPEAIFFAEEGLNLGRAMGDRWGISHWLMSLGQLALLQGDPHRALAMQRESLLLRWEMGDRRATADSLEGIGWSLAALDRSTGAIQCLAVADAARTAIGHQLLPLWHGPHEMAINGLRSRLGGASFQHLWNESAQTVVTVVVEKVLNDALDDQIALPDPLTRREHEVALLISQGISNRSIANRLVIAETTVERHVANILNKLGLESRTQIAVWIIRGDGL